MIRQDLMFGNGDFRLLERAGSRGLRFPRHAAIASILLVALLAFEVFNFDTTRYALENLLGPVSFAGLGWATVLAIAFCAIDFAGLVRLFTPEQNGEQPREVWYLMGAWLLGATMNAVMTWWAVSLTLLNHDFGNEVLTRDQLLQYVPVFVAVLVWLTRILFIGALTITGGQILGLNEDRKSASGARELSPPTGRPLRERSATTNRRGAKAVRPQETLVAPGGYPHVSDELPPFLTRRRAGSTGQAEPTETLVSEGQKETKQARNSGQVSEDGPGGAGKSHNSRVRQRPPLPGVRNSATKSPSRNGN